MAYIGNPVQQALTKVTSQSFNGTGSQTVFTLNRAVNTGEELEVFVNNVQQEPGVGKSYTATGTTLTFDAAPSSGTGNIYVVYRGLAEVTRRLEHDPNAALAATTGTFSGDLTVDTNTLYVDSTNNRVGIGTSSPYNPGGYSRVLDIRGANGSQIVIGGTASNPTSTALQVDASNGNFLLSNNKGGSSLVFRTSVSDDDRTERMQIDSSGRVTMPYQPSFSCYKNGIMTEASGNNRVESWTENHDQGGHFDNSTGRFTAPVSGKYFFAFSAMHSGNVNGDVQYSIYKNGGVYQGSNDTADGSSWDQCTVVAVVAMAANDYVEPYAYSSATSTREIVYSGRYSGWHGYLIG